MGRKSDPVRASWSTKTELCYSFGKLDGIFLVRRSAPAGMTHSYMLDIMPGTLSCSSGAQGDYLPSLELKARHLLERASDGLLRNLLRTCLRYKVERLGDVN